MAAVPLLVAALLVLGSAPARADEDGIKIGEGRLHPYLALRGRWDSFASVDGMGHMISDFLFDINPGLTLQRPSGVLAINLNADVDEVLYRKNSNLDRTLINADLTLDFFNQGLIGLQLADRFTRANNPTVSVLPYAVIGDLNAASMKLPIRPGGGALVFTPGYEFIYQHFENFRIPPSSIPSCPLASPDCTPSNASTLDYFEHHGSLDVSWHFLPKTAALLDGDFFNVTYTNNGTGANEPLGLLDVTLGLAGLLTNHIEVLAKAGYAQTLLAPPAIGTLFKKVRNDQTVVGQLQFGYLLSETGSVRIGFVRSLLPEPSGLAYLEDNRPYANLNLKFGRLQLHLDVSLDIDGFANNLESTGSRTDLIFHLDLGPEVEVFRWFQVGAGYNLTSLGSNDTQAFAVYNGSSALVGGSGYTNHELYLRLTFVY